MITTVFLKQKISWFEYSIGITYYNKGGWFDPLMLNKTNGFNGIISLIHSKTDKKYIPFAKQKIHVQKR